MLQALGTIWFRFLQKKSKKKFHACVPLISPGGNYPAIAEGGAQRPVLCVNKPKKKGARSE